MSNIRLMVVGLRPEISKLQAHVDELYIATTRRDLERYANFTQSINTLIVDSYDDIQLLAILISELNVSHLATCVEMAVIPCAALRAAYGLFGQKVENALLFRDKALQKRRISMSTDIPVMPWKLFDPGAGHSSESPAHIAAQFEYPVIVKPTYLGGSHGVTRLDTEALLIGHLEQNQHRLVIEKYCETHEWHLDGAWNGEEIRSLMVSKYLSPVIETNEFLASVSFPPRLHSELYECSAAFVSDCLRCLSMPSGVFHLEAFGEHQPTIFGECAYRPGGGMISDVYQRRFGDSLWYTHVAMSTGLSYTPHLGGSDYYIGFLIPRTIEGKTCVTGNSWFLSFNGVWKCALRTREYELMGPSSGSASGVAHVGLETDSYSGFLERVETIMTKFSDIYIND